jgi:hypothetical protein
MKKIPKDIRQDEMAGRKVGEKKSKWREEIQNRIRLLNLAGS